MATLYFRIDGPGSDEDGRIYMPPILLVDGEAMADFSILGVDLNKLARESLDRIKLAPTKACSIASDTNSR